MVPDTTNPRAWSYAINCGRTITAFFEILQSSNAKNQYVLLKSIYYIRIVFRSKVTSTDVILRPSIFLPRYDSRALVKVRIFLKTRLSTFWKRNFSMRPHFLLTVCRSVRWSVIISFFTFHAPRSAALVNANGSRAPMGPGAETGG